MIRTGVIRDSTSSFASPIVMVKKNGSWRLCVDYKQINQLTIKDKFLIPIIDELLDELSHARVFFKLSLRSRYHQIRINDTDIDKTTSRTHERHFEFLVMPFGLTNAPSSFQALINVIFKPLLRKIYLGHVIARGTVAMNKGKVVCVANWPTPTCIKELRIFLGLTRYNSHFIRYYGNLARPLTNLLKKNAWQ
ncbi:reverse transcriptase [Gossypium australe]|uniref:Reverse transcriptase n=1 Tax=Gossypium australe TaxID=47621 RepID=A0A5B6X4E7_9ROSI|nr:reverse transcriptase [Gossypium australe]